jgi:hypothetical protein
VVYKPGSQNVVTDTLSRCYEDTAVADACAPANSVVACLSGVSDVNIPVGQSAVQAVETGFAAHDDDVSDEVIIIQTIFGSLGVSVVSLQQVADATDADQYLPSVRQFVISGWSTKTELPPPLRPFWSVQNELTTTAN